MLGRIEEKEEHWRDAFGSYSKALQLDPSNVAARIKRAELLLAGNRRKDALEEARAVLTDDPNNADALRIRAAIYFRDGDIAG